MVTIRRLDICTIYFYSKASEQVGYMLLNSASATSALVVPIIVGRSGGWILLSRFRVFFLSRGRRISKLMNLVRCSDYF